MKPYEFTGDLYPIMSPKFNLREICKQIVLLEDHLNQVKKRCPDCIRKHLLTIEGLFEEAISLDTEGTLAKQLEQAPDYFRYLQERWSDGADERRIAQAIRKIRKGLTPLCFDMRKTASSYEPPLNQILLKQASRNLEHFVSASPSRVAFRFASKKTEAEKDDKEIGKKVRKEPRKLPPHVGTRSKYIGTDVDSRDPDMKGVGKSEGGDPDLFRKRKAAQRRKKKVITRFPNQFYKDLADVKVKNPNTGREVLLSSLKPKEDPKHQKIVQRFYDKWKAEKKKKKRETTVDLSSGIGRAFGDVRAMSKESRKKAYDNAHNLFMKKKSATGGALMKKVALLGVAQIVEGDKETEFSVADGAIKRLIANAEKKGKTRREKGLAVRQATHIFVNPMSEESRQAMISSMDGMGVEEIAGLTNSKAVGELEDMIKDFDHEDPYGRDNLNLTNKQRKINGQKHEEARNRMIDILKRAAAAGMLEECLKTYNDMKKIMEGGGKGADQKAKGSRSTGGGGGKGTPTSDSFEAELAPSSSSSTGGKSKKPKAKPLTKSQIKDFKSIQLKMLEELKEKATWLTPEQKKALNKALREREPKLFYETHPNAEEVLAERK